MYEDCKTRGVVGSPSPIKHWMRGGCSKCQIEVECYQKQFWKSYPAKYATWEQKRLHRHYTISFYRLVVIIVSFIRKNSALKCETRNLTRVRMFLCFSAFQWHWWSLSQRHGCSQTDETLLKVQMLKQWPWRVLAACCSDREVNGRCPPSPYQIRKKAVIASWVSFSKE